MTDRRTTPIWRTWLFRLAMIVFVLGLITSTIAVWADQRVHDSDSWAETVGPLADDPAVQEYVVDQAALLIDNQIAADEDAGRLQNVTRGQISTLARIALTDFVSSPTFSSWWTEANRITHRALLGVLTDGEQDLINTYEGDLVLNLQPAIDWVNGHLAILFPSSNYSISIPPERSTVILYSSETLAQITNVIEIIDTLAFVLPVITLVSLAALLMLATKRIEALKLLGLGTAISMVVLLAVMGLGRSWFISNQDANVQDLLEPLIRIVLIDLTMAFRVLAVLGLAVAGIAYAANSRYLRDPRIRAFLHNNRELLTGGAVVLAVLAMVVTPYPPAWLTVLVLLLVVTGVVLLVKWQGANEAAELAPLTSQKDP